MEGHGATSPSTVCKMITLFGDHGDVNSLEEHFVKTQNNPLDTESIINNFS